jgi:hypothetical protein
MSCSARSGIGDRSAIVGRSRILNSNARHSLDRADLDECLEAIPHHPDIRILLCADPRSANDRRPAACRGREMIDSMGSVFIDTKWSARGQRFPQSIHQR